MNAAKIGFGAMQWLPSVAHFWINRKTQRNETLMAQG
jgi:hypothetical protein